MRDGRADLEWVSGAVHPAGWICPISKRRGGKPRRDSGDPKKDLGGRRNERMWDLRREIYSRVATELGNTWSYIYRIKSVSVAGWAGVGISLG